MLINNNTDILIEILIRLDAHSLASATCVCRLWHTLLSNDLLWERLCFRNIWPPPPGVRLVVSALGGYRRLYAVCVRPALTRLHRAGWVRPTQPKWTRHQVELSLSLFCVDYYERMDSGAVAPPSLMFLCDAMSD